LPLTVTVAALALLALALPAAHAAVTTPLDRIVAIVDDGVVIQSELDQRLENVRAQIAQRKIQPPPAPVLRQQVLDQLIMERIQLDRARTFGLEPTAAQLDDAFANVANQNKMSPEAFAAALRRDGVSLAAFREDLRRQVTMQMLIDREVRSRIAVSDNEVDIFLAEQAAFGAGEEYNLSHILIPVGEAASPATQDQAKQQAEALRERALAGESFAQLAIANSKGPNALQGGALGWRQAGQLPDIFLQAVRKMKPGEVSPVLATNNGYHLLRLNERRGGEQKQTVVQTHARHILMRPSEVRPASQARAELARLRTRIESGEKFDNLARAYSEDAISAARGGDLGWTSPGELVPEFQQALDKLAPGHVSNVVETRFGYHLIEVLARRNQDISAELERTQARQQIFVRKTEERLQTWLRELRDEAYIEIVDTAAP
jgi:peptidyl-prolyl cis-trans isomerase SurA